MVAEKKKKEVKAMQSEIKKNIQRNKSEGKQIRTQINMLEQKEEITIQLEQMKKQEFKKIRRSLFVRDNFECFNI